MRVDTILCPSPANTNMNTTRTQGATREPLESAARPPRRGSQLLLPDTSKSGDLDHPAHPRDFAGDVSAHVEADPFDEGDAADSTRGQASPEGTQGRQGRAQQAADGALLRARGEPCGRVPSDDRPDADLVRPVPGPPKRLGLHRWNGQRTVFRDGPYESSEPGRPRCDQERELPEHDPVHPVDCPHCRRRVLPAAPDHEDEEG